MNPHDVLMYGQRTVQAVLDRLEPGDWDVIALGVWTTKDLVGHLGAFEVRFAEALAPFAGEELRTDLLRADRATFNDDQAAIRRDWPVEAVLIELAEAHELVMTLVPRIGAETWREVGTIPWYGLEYSLEDLLVYTMYGHKREHAPQLQAVLERPGRSTSGD
jgi:hypothetical protein